MPDVLTRPTRVLIVDDEPQLLRALRINLTARAYDVITAADGHQALRAARDHHPDLVVLDLGLPDMDGLDLIHTLREQTPVPIVVLSGRSGNDDKVDALDAGADDYLTKPFDLDELLARVRAVTRRLNPPAAAEIVRIGSYLVDLDRHTVQAADDCAVTVHLTPTEWRLLAVLLRQPGRLIPQHELLAAVRGTAQAAETHYLRQYMAQLRRKIEDDPARPRHLLTVPGVGYRFAG